MRAVCKQLHAVLVLSTWLIFFYFLKNPRGEISGEGRRKNLGYNETPIEGMTMTNPADKAIIDLIDHLAAQCKKWTTTEDERSTYIKEIAKLRASMNPTIIQQKD